MKPSALYFMSTLLYSSFLISCGSNGKSNPDTSSAVEPKANGPDLTLTSDSLHIEHQHTKRSLLLELVHEGAKRPIYFTQVPQTRYHLVVQQRGDILWYQKGSREAGGVFMQVPDSLSGANEEGLLGLAFDPDFGSNGYFYLHYTQDIDKDEDCINEIEKKRDSCSIIARYQLAKNAQGGFIFNQGNPASKQVVLMQRQPWSNHNGGMIAFGHDRFLYIGLGDGGSGGDPRGYAQNRNSLLGKILRIDVSTLPYSIPADNPFRANTQGYREEIWAYGLRNPWRFSFDKQTHYLWAGDVGQNSWEEIDVIQGGGNYGWNFFEGNHDFKNVASAPNNTIAPIIEYSSREGKSVTGGYVYRGSLLKGWNGWYFYGDFVSQKVWALNTDTVNSDNLEYREVMSTGFPISSFAVDEQQELYIVDFSGSVYRFLAD